MYVRWTTGSLCQMAEIVGEGVVGREEVRVSVCMNGAASEWHC
jgi:hypothetical protein